MEQVDDGPEQVFDVGLQARVGKGGDEGVEDVGQCGADNVLFGQWPGVGFVLERAVAVELEFGEKRGGGGVGAVRFVVAGVDDRGRTGLAPPGRSPERPQRSEGRRGAANLLGDAKSP